MLQRAMNYEKLFYCEQYLVPPPKQHVYLQLVELDKLNQAISLTFVQKNENVAFV